MIYLNIHLFHTSLIPFISLDQHLAPNFTIYQICKIRVSFAIKYTYTCTLCTCKFLIVLWPDIAYVFWPDRAYAFWRDRTAYFWPDRHYVFEQL